MNFIMSNPGLSHIAKDIFCCLDENKSLCQSLLVCKTWYDFLDNSLFFHRKLIRNAKSLHMKKSWLQVHCQWNDVIDDIYMCTFLI